MAKALTIELPDGTEDYEADIRVFVYRMLAKLQKNRHKGHWDDINVPSALSRLHDEIYELEDAIRSGNSEEIHNEAADVANFALIISSVLGREPLAPAAASAQLEFFESVVISKQDIYIDQTRYAMKNSKDPHLVDFEEQVSNDQILALKRMLNNA